MHPARLVRRELDPRAGSVARQPGGDRRGAPERAGGVAVLDEHLRAGGFGAAVPDVVDDRPADVAGSGRLNGRPVFCWTIVMVFARQSRSLSSSWRRPEIRRPSRAVIKIIA